jgi:diguanylate cyclase (GGDEF)-like protein/PAS domain S-box-containing protein
MHEELKNQIKAATVKSSDKKLGFSALLKLIDEHYDQMEATLSETLSQSMATTTPIEVIFDSVTDALFSVSDKGIIRNCNKVCSRYFGIEKDELIGTSIGTLIPAVDNQPLGEFLTPFISNVDDTSIQFKGGEVSAVRANGETFDAEISSSQLDGPGGKVFVISLRDISGRKEAERTLRENEERYRALVENAPEAIVVLDVESNRFVDANENACELFNLSRSRLLSIGPQAISPRMQPDGLPSFGVRRGYIDRALAGEHPIFEWLHRDSQGKDIPSEVRFTRLPDRARKLIRVSITNISDRKRNEEFAAAENKILEMIASSRAYDKTLKSICNCAEKVGSGMHAAIMRLDIKHQTLSVEEAPSLTEEFRLALEFIRVEEVSLTCGAAVFAAHEKFTEDLSQDKGWSKLARTAADFGFASCWSFPVLGASERIIGTLDIYRDVVGQPNTDELDKFGRLARLSGIAMKRHLDEQKMRTSESRYRGLFENVVDGVYITSREGDIITVNPALVEMLGYDSAEEMKAAGRTTVFYVNPIDRERVFARLEAEGFVKNFEYRLRRKDGAEIVVLENSRAIYDDDGNIVAHEGTITDITERKKAETRVFEEKERAQVTLQSIGDGVITTDANGCVDYVNPVAQGLTGWEGRNARGKPIEDIMSIVNEHTRASVENPVTRCLKEGRIIALAANSMLVTSEGAEVPIQDSAAPIRDRMGNIIGAVMVFHDVSKESRLFRQLSYQASHDSLTGLINRREFENRLVESLDKTHSNPDHEHALLYLDLDQFKVVNDTFGHTAGDELLRQISELVQANIRSTDILARLGGDEFGILLERCTEDRAMEVAEAIRMAIENYRFTWQDAFTAVRASIGVVLVNNQCEDVASIMSSADVACYSAKDMGRNKTHLYEDSDASARHEEMKWVSRITSAVEENRLELFYQPIVGISKSNANSRGHYELLLRMRDENGELVQAN